MRARTLRRLLLAGGATAVAVLLAAPYWNLDRYRRQIQAGLERELHRPVTVGNVRLELLRGPGVALSDVVIEDDPRAGKEPFAYVTALEARIALRSLWTGKLEFASLRLVEPSLNLVKPAAGSWNFVDLVSRPPGLPASDRTRAPAIAVRSGRINFKFGDTKSVLYLANADLDLAAPENARDPWQVRFTGEPARADRPAQSLGRVVARGRIWPGRRLELSVELERSYLEEISTLLGGRDLGLRGSVTSRARLEGPISALRFTGEARLRDFRRWDLLPPLGGDWQVSYAGGVDLPGQRLHLEVSPAPDWPLKAHWEVTQFLSEPQWTTRLSLDGVPLKAAQDFLRALGIPAPEHLDLSGKISGEVGYSPPAGWQGSLWVRDAVATLASGMQLRCAQAPVIIGPGQIRLGPWKLEGPDGGRLALEGSVGTHAPQVSLTLKGERLPVTVGGAPLWPGLAPVAVMESSVKGVWAGLLRYAQPASGPGRWTGRFELRDAEMPVPGLARPLQIHEAQVQVGGDEIVVHGLRGAVGNIPVRADYSARPTPAHPAELKLEIGDVDLEELERVFTPVLDRRRSLLARALRRARAPVPNWLLRRRMQGEFQVESLTWAGSKLAGSVRGRLQWDALQVTLAAVEAKLPEGALRGRAEIDLRQATPTYGITAVLGPLETGSGRWWIEGWLETEGLADQLLENLRAGGALLGREVTVAPDEEFDLVAARFAVRIARRLPRLTIEGVEAIQRDAVYRGQCRADGEGRLSADLSSERRNLRLEGTLWPFKLARVHTP